MSQQQTFTSANSIPGIPNVEFVEGNDSVAVAPNAVTHVITIIGNTVQGVSVTNTAPNTETITVANATTSSLGVVSLNPLQFTVTGGEVSLIGGTTTAAIQTINSIGPNASGNFNLLGTANQVLITAGTNEDIISLTGPYTPTTFTLNGILFGNGTSSIGVTAQGAANTVLLGNGGVPTFGSVPNAALANDSVTLSSGNNVTVTGGGPLTLGGTASFNLTGTTAHAVQIGNAGGSLTSLAIGTTGQVLTGVTGSDPIWSSPATSGTVTSVSVATANGFAGTVANPTTTPAITMTTTATGILSGNGTAISGSAVTQFDVLVGGASNAVSSVGPGTAGQVLQSGGAAANPVYSTATYPSTTTINQILYSSAANTVSGLATANNGVLITSATGVPSVLAGGTTGQVLTATTGSPASWVSPATSGTVTSVSVVSANGFAGTVANATTTPAITLTTTITGILTGNGTAISGSTVTQHGVLVGGATNAVSSTSVGATGTILQGNSGADPTYSTATYPSTTTINQLLFSSAANTIGGLATANSAALVTTSAGVPVFSGTMTNGQIIIGSTGATPVAGTLTAGAGISITNTAGGIAVAATGAGFTWSDNSGTFTPVKENGYFITGTSTANLPASPSEGDTIAFAIDTASLLTIQANTGQTLRFADKLSASGGTAVNTLQGDTCELVFRSATSVWFCLSFEGGWNVT
jgi:trimeric autotransporter adhesin